MAEGTDCRMNRLQTAGEGLQEKAEEKTWTTEIPASTYRLQMHGGFPLRTAIQIIPYLSALGISHCYLSPLLRAKKGSMHGYDIVNHKELNPEIGSLEDLDAFVCELKKYNMGLILDIVPNHMGIGPDNPWWADVLENGPASAYADYFDVDWSPIKSELFGKVLLPILGDSYGSVLKSGQLRIDFDQTKGSLSLCYFDHHLPLNPVSYPAVLGRRSHVLKERFGTEDPDVMDYLSILTAFQHLPNHIEPVGFSERIREKKTQMRRLSALCQRNSGLTDFIFENLSEFEIKEDDPSAIERMHELLEQQAYRLAYWRVSSDEINYRRFFDVDSLAAIRTEDGRVFKEMHELVFRLVRDGKVQGLRIDHPDGLFDPAQYFSQLQAEVASQCQISYHPGTEPVNNAGIGAGNSSATSAANNRENGSGNGSENGSGNGSEMSSANNAADDSGISAGSSGAESSVPAQSLPIYIVVEKILAPFEHLEQDWTVHGTVGYEFLNAVNALLIDTSNEQKFTDLYDEFLGDKINYDNLKQECKYLILDTVLASELNVLSHRLNKIAESSWFFRDLTLNSLKSALRGVLSSFPVYRTYVKPGKVEKSAKQYIDWAVGLARKKSPLLHPNVYEFLRQVLTLDLVESAAEYSTLADPRALEQTVQNFAMKFQQFTGPVMAKSVEDTAFYRYNRFVGLNEVGGEPHKFGGSQAGFHHQNQLRQQRHPYEMLSTSTHDTKRSEDVRARLAILSELPEFWREKVLLWSRMNRSRKVEIDGEQAPDPNDEYLLYQTLVGVFPLELRLDIIEQAAGSPEIGQEPTERPASCDAGSQEPIERSAGSHAGSQELIERSAGHLPAQQETIDHLSERLEQYILKAARESKRRTSWINQNKEYETALINFVRKTLTPSSTNRFVDDVQSFAKQLAPFGLLNSLVQTLLKLTCPGVPDIYQGCELWDFSLVDPDNRRPVNYALRAESLGKMQQYLDLMFEKNYGKHNHLSGEHGSGRPHQSSGYDKPLPEECAKLIEFNRWLVNDITSGRIKQYVIAAITRLRAQVPKLFTVGKYIPIEVCGTREKNIIAFARKYEESAVIVVAPYLIASTLLANRPGDLTTEPFRAITSSEYWQDTYISMPAELQGLSWQNLFSLQSVESAAEKIFVSTILQAFPLCVLRNRS